MRFFQFLFLFSCCCVHIGCSQTTANVFIDPGAEFVLGEYENSSYRASVENKGRDIIFMDVVGKADRIVQTTIPLEPGKKVTRNVDPETQLHFRNTSQRKATILARLSEGVEGMRYVEPGEERFLDVNTSPSNMPVSPREKMVYNFQQEMTIPARQTLTFAPKTPATYSAVINNRGSMDVSIRSRETGTQTQGFGTGKRSSNTVYLNDGEVLTLINTTNRPARVRLELTEDLTGFSLSGTE